MALLLLIGRHHHVQSSDLRVTPRIIQFGTRQSGPSRREQPKRARQRVGWGDSIVGSNIWEEKASILRNGWKAWLLLLLDKPQALSGLTPNPIQPRRKRSSQLTCSHHVRFPEQYTLSTQKVPRYRILRLCVLRYIILSASQMGEHLSNSLYVEC